MGRQIYRLLKHAKLPWHERFDDTESQTRPTGRAVGDGVGIYHAEWVCGLSIACTGSV